MSRSAHKPEPTEGSPAVEAGSPLPFVADTQTRALFESAPNGVAMLAPDQHIRLANSALARMFAYELPELEGRSFADLLPPDQAEKWRAAQASVVSGEAPSARLSCSGLRKDGTTFPIDAVMTPFRPGGERMVLTILIDASDRRRAEERQHLLIGELHHRTQNIFAVIQSIASRTLSGQRSLAEAKQVFLDRLHALSRTYTVLTEEAWEGAPIDKILRDELAPFSGRVAISGEPIMIQPSAAQTLAMIFHELATNAIKHGALSVPDGHLEIAWWTVPGESGPELSFVWTEHGGPAVTPPARKGYGRTILEDGARHIGRAELTYAPEGLRYALTAPLSAIGWSARTNMPFGGQGRLF